MIQPALAQAVLARALKTGGDFAEIFAEDTLSNNLTMTDNRMENALSAHRYGAGLRVFKGTQTVYVYTNDLTETGLTRLADQAAAAMGAAQVQGPAFSLIERYNPNINPCRVVPSSASTCPQGAHRQGGLRRRQGRRSIHRSGVQHPAGRGPEGAHRQQRRALHHRPAHPHPPGADRHRLQRQRESAGLVGPVAAAWSSLRR